MAPAESQFSEGEKILCFHGPLMYEAKCLKVQINEKDNTNEYMVHYQGWNKNWDEWVPESRIMKYNDANLAKQNELKASQESKKAKRASRGGRNSKITKDVKAGDAKSEGSVHDSDSRSSTPSVDGRSRKDGRGKSKAAKEVKQGSPPPAEAPPEPEANSEELTEHTPAAPPAAAPVTAVSEAPVQEVKPPAQQAKPPAQQAKPPAQQAKPPVQQVKPPVQQVKPPAQQVKPPAPVEPEEPPVVPEKRPKVVPVVRPCDINFTSEPILSNPDNTVLVIPNSLNRWIIDDWDQITRLNRLVNLPAKVTVVDILARYQNFKLETSPPDQHDEIRQKVELVEDLFSHCLGSYLLHKWERPQYADLLDAHPDERVSKIYGSHHFLRLFNQAGKVLGTLPAAVMDPASKDLADILDFLSNNAKEFFSVSNFGTATPEYHRRAI